MSANPTTPAPRSDGRITAASAQMFGGEVAICMTVKTASGVRGRRFICGAADALALATMLQLAVARAASPSSERPS